MRRSSVMKGLESLTKPGFRNWEPKIGNCKILGCPFFQGRPQYTHITNINKYLLNEVKQKCPYTMPLELY